MEADRLCIQGCTGLPWFRRAALPDSPELSHIPLCVQVVREAEDGDISDTDDNYPGRAYAALELLERQMVGLRRQLCQVCPAKP